MPLQRGFHHLLHRLAVPGREVPGTVAAQGMQGTGSAEEVDQNLLAGSLRIAGVGTDLQSLAVAGIAAAAGQRSLGSLASCSQISPVPGTCCCIIVT